MNRAVERVRQQTAVVMENTERVTAAAPGIVSAMAERYATGAYEEKTKRLLIPMGETELQQAHELARCYGMSLSHLVRTLLREANDAHRSTLG